MLKRALLSLVAIELGIILLVVLVRAFFDPGWNDAVWLLWVPVLLPFAPLWLWLRPVVQGSAYKGTLVLFAWLIAGFSMHYAMAAFEKSTGKLIEVKSIAEISSYPGEKYFKIGSFEVDTAHTVHGSWIRRAGKYNEFLLIDLYFAVPFVDASGYWYKLSFHKEMKVGDRERDAQFETFLTECKVKIRSYDFADVSHFKIDNSEERRYFVKAIAQTGATQAVLLAPSPEPFGAGSAAAIWLAVEIFLGGLLAFALAVFGMQFGSPKTQPS